jgi:beta-xylosidase
MATQKLGPGIIWAEDHEGKCHGVVRWPHYSLDPFFQMKRQALAADLSQYHEQPIHPYRLMKPSRLVLILSALLALPFTSARAQPATKADFAGPKQRTGLRLPDIWLHDPCILADKVSQTYYLYTSSMPRRTGKNRAGTYAYKSKDLALWDGPFLVFECPDDSWAVSSVGAWAPEVHAYQGKYYLFTTLHNPTKQLPAALASEPNLMRATIIAVSDSPQGPFVMLKKDSPITPANFMALDGTLYVDPDGQPWMVYAHEWVQKIDGTIEAIRLKKDLSEAVGEPIHLFKGSDAPWLNAQAKPNSKPSLYVTDGPQLFRTKTGTLLMLWSSYEKNSFNGDGYVETVARSKSGNIEGPWEQLPPLVQNDSGHGMLFRSFEGQLMLVLHQPFERARGKIYEIDDLGDSLRVAKFREDLSGPPLGPLPGQKPR